MKISFILPEIGVSGGVRSTFEIANRLKAKGHDVSIIYPAVVASYGHKWYDLGRLAGRIIKTVKNLTGDSGVDWFDLKADLIMVPTLAERHIPEGDIIVATWWSNAYDIAGYGPERGEKFYFIRSYEIWGGPKEKVDGSYKLPLKKIVTSSNLKHLIESKFNVSTLGPLPNGIDFDLFYRENDSFDSHTPKRVGVLCRPGKGKGIEDALEAFRSAKKECSDMKLVLFGKRPSKKDLRTLGDEVPEEIHITPSGDDLRRIYNSLDIFIFSSRFEGFGNPPMEAMACGAACITTDVGAAPEYTQPGKTALMSPPGDVRSITDNLVQLAIDEDRRERIARSGYDFIKKFSWDDTVDRVEEIFSETLKKGEGI
ncbi:glycosyltransferase family 4 protein [Candidatus Omnitrophota bacterium]